MGKLMEELVISGSEADRAVLFEDFERKLNRAFDEELDQDLALLAFVEAVNNAAEHGNRDDPSKKIIVRSIIKKGSILVSVLDEGSGFSPLPMGLEKVSTLRGRGLGLIVSNTDLVFSNDKGNEIVFIKGGIAVQDTTFKARISHLNGKIVFITEIEHRAGEKFYHVISEALSKSSPLGPRIVLLDMRNVRILTSADWGMLFAEAEDEGLEEIILFNANEALITVAKQMGIDQREAPYNKIKVNKGVDQVMNRLNQLLNSQENG